MAENSNRVAIVGGGIAGMYCAWKLGARHQDVTLFECLDRLGGRIETLHWDGFQAECGPMRFELGTQPLLHRLGKDLDIPFVEFPSPRSETARFPRYNLEAAEKSSTQQQAEAELARQLTLPSGNGDLIELSHLTTSLELLKLAVYRILRPCERRATLSQIMQPPATGGSAPIVALADEWHEDEAKPRERHYNVIRQQCRLDGEHGPYLHAIGFWNALARVLSAGALAKLRDTGTFYHLMPENPAASEWTIFWLRLFRSDAGLSTVPNGVDQITHKLAAKIDDLPSVKVRRSARVTAVAPDSEGRVLVHWLASGEARCDKFDHVILALPQMPMRSLAGAFPDDVRRHVESVNAFPLTKVFVRLKKRWWVQEPLPQTGAHVLPTREIHYFTPRDSDDPSGMVMFYTDRPATAYWHPFVAEVHERAQVDAPSALREELVREVLKELLTYAHGRARMRAVQDASEVTASMQIATSDRSHRRETQVSVQRTWLVLDGASFDELLQILRFLGESPLGRELTALPDVKRIFDALDDNVASFAIRDWSRPPFGAAAHAWQPGTDVPTALERLRAFGLRGAEQNHCVHICGEAYSDYQGFIEGALRTVEAVIAAIGTATPAKAPSANSRAPKLRAGGARHRASAGARAAVQKRRPTT